MASDADRRGSSPESELSEASGFLTHASSTAAQSATISLRKSPKKPAAAASPPPVAAWINRRIRNNSLLGRVLGDVTKTSSFRGPAELASERLPCLAVPFIHLRFLRKANFSKFLAIY